MRSASTFKHEGVHYTGSAYQHGDWLVVTFTTS